jgi:hypothetical protein
MAPILACELRHLNSPDGMFIQQQEGEVSKLNVIKCTMSGVVLRLLPALSDFDVLKGFLDFRLRLCQDLRKILVVIVLFQHCIDNRPRRDT